MRWDGESERWLGEALDVAGYETVSGEIDDAVIGKRHALDIRLTGFLSKLDIACGGAELSRDRLEFIGGVRQPRQGSRELSTINASALPIIGVGTGDDCSRRSLTGVLGRLQRGFGTEDWIAEADHWLGPKILAREYP